MGAEERLAAGAAAVEISDEMPIEGIAGLKWQLRAQLATGARYIVTDVRNVRRLSSSAVAALLSAHRVCSTRGGAVVVRNPNRRTLDVLRRTGLHQVFRIEGAGVQPDR